MATPETVAPDVHRIPLLPGDGLNAYVVGDVLIDAGMARSAKTVLAAIRGRTVSGHVATHAHLDHVGGSAEVLAALGLPGLAVGAGDAEAVRTGIGASSSGLVGRLLGRVGGFPPSRVIRELHEGDDVGPGFEVLDAPGHSPGQIVLWRASDRLLIAGDVLNNVAGRLREPPGFLNTDSAQNRRSVLKLAALEPATVVFGHGQVLRDGTKLTAYADAL